MRRSAEFLASLGGHREEEFEWLERFLETATPRWKESEYRRKVEEYFERMLALMRSSALMDDLR